MVRWQELQTGLTAAASHGNVQNVPQDVREVLSRLGWIAGSEADLSGVYPTAIGWQWLKRYRRSVRRTENYRRVRSSHT